jgi:hypothetical protein
MAIHGGVCGFVGSYRRYAFPMPAKGSRSAERVKVTCPCGTEFEVPRSRYEAGRGRRCSKPCQYRYATRPSGLKYNVTKENPTTFKQGDRPWNKDQPLKERITYKELHRWVARRKTKTGRCSKCRTEGYTEWANVSHEYRRDLDDWAEMCRRCHRAHDNGDGRGAATRLFGKDQVQNG